MTTKIQNIAMFAIAAFALVGMMGVPAFAASTPINTSVTANTGIAQSNYSDKGCGPSMDCESKVKSYTTSNKVKVYYGVENGSCASVQLEAWVNGNQILDTTRSNVSGTGQYVTGYGTVTNGDSITATATFVSCI